ncbi:MAG: M18 family aminopeptidase, partial [Erysipelotrichia bacterium]|nr:M18 family aminopeptidase [Erysipelotrichia bacterium]
MNDIKITEELLKFISNSPSMFHSVRTIRQELDQAGFTYLAENQKWNIQEGCMYYAVRNQSSIIAFRIGKKLSDYHFQMTAAHGDSPTFKIKTVSELEGPGEYLKLDVEAYGGMIDSTWLDRPLGVAGRVLVKNEDRIETKLLHIEKDVLLIPNLAIHMNRDVNKGTALNRQVDLCPLFSAGSLKK